MTAKAKSGKIFTAKNKPKTAESRKMMQDLYKEIKKIKCSFLAGIDCFPRATKFENQEKEEQIILFLRQHFIVNFRWFF